MQKVLLSVAKKCAVAVITVIAEEIIRNWGWKTKI